MPVAFGAVKARATASDMNRLHREKTDFRRQDLVSGSGSLRRAEWFDMCFAVGQREGRDFGIFVHTPCHTLSIPLSIPIN
jgi:hypothetical protein